LNELETVDIENVEILAVGKWNGVPSTKEYTKKDLDELVRSFKALSSDEKLNYEPPLKLGHDEHQKLLQKDGYPAAGWVKALKRIGNKLVASFGEVPKKIGDIIKAGGYKKVSSEIYHDYAMGDYKFPLVLKAVALLGGDIPAVKTIADIQAQYSQEDGVDVVIYEFGEQSVSLEEILSDIDSWLEKAEVAIHGKVGSPAIRTYLKEVKLKLRNLIGKETKLAEELNLDRKLRLIYDAFYEMIQPITLGESYPYIREMHKDHIIMEKGNEHYKIPFSEKDGEVVFDMENAVKVKLVYEPTKEKLMEFKEWDVAYINDLPDSAFAYIRSGGEKDEDGKTVPRALRFLPYKNIQGNVDLPHLRNALARLTQTSLTIAEQAKARKVLVAAAEKAGVGDYEKEERMEKELRELLKTDETTDILEVVRKLVEEKEEKVVSLVEYEATEKKVTALETKLAERERDERVTKAINSGKITPAQKEWADKYAMSDPSGFDSFIEKQPVVVQLGEIGSSGNEAVGLTEAEISLGEKLGVSKEALIAAKKEEKK
ncbi:MAG: hypothetical protein COW51_00070, partial [Candidatus Moranbacteria bacterium CG17_big_fil_post_rev_8_21_14_2_50_44_12]